MGAAAPTVLEGAPTAFAARMFRVNGTSRLRWLGQGLPRFTTAELLRMRSWSKRELGRAIAAAVRDHLGFERADGSFALTDAGLREAERVVRNHRLWEVYLITHADIAPSHVDRDADAIEHVLEPAMLRELEAALAQPEPTSTVPASPHAIKTPSPA